MGLAKAGFLLLFSGVKIRKWVLQLDGFIKKIDDDGVIEVYPNIYIMTSKFKGLFKGAETYNDFLKIDNEEKGYKRFLDECKEKGLLN